MIQFEWKVLYFVTPQVRQSSPKTSVKEEFANFVKKGIEIAK